MDNSGMSTPVSINLNYNFRTFLVFKYIYLKLTNN